MMTIWDALNKTDATTSKPKGKTLTWHRTDNNSTIELFETILWRTNGTRPFIGIFFYSLFRFKLLAFSRVCSCFTQHRNWLVSLFSSLCRLWQPALPYHFLSVCIILYRTVCAISISAPMWHLSQMKGFDWSFTSLIWRNFHTRISSKPLRLFLDKSNSCKNNNKCSKNTFG